jgi:PAS domain S-box-containing protein
MSTATTRSLLDVLNDLFFVFNENGELIEWNQASVDVTGYSDGELRSMAPTDFFVGDVQVVERAIRDVFSTGEAAFQADLVTATGERIPYQFDVSKVTNEAGEAVGFAGIGRDFTEEQQRRERLQQREETLRRMHEIIADRDRPFEAQVEALLDLARTELRVEYGTLSRIRGDDYYFEVVSADDGSIGVGDVVPVSATNCEIVATTEETLVAGDVARDVPDADERPGYTDWGITCYLGAPVYVDEEVYGTFCVYGKTPRTAQFTEWEVTLVDLMSRWVSYELQRQLTSERLQRHNETLERFASMVSHDLRNPLNVMQGSLTLAEETGDADHFDRCRRTIERMDSLVSDLLVLARTGTELDELTDIDLGPFARSCWETVPTSNATLRVETTTTIHADETRLRQLFENLFRNSVEHGSTKSGPAPDTDTDTGVTVTVGDLDGGFFVADDGPGVPPDERDRVFEIGYSSQHGGTGLGLDIVERIADVHDWTVTLTESDDGGARFEFTGVTVDA